MNEIYQEVFRYAKSMWRYRWISMIIAWVVTVLGWAYVVMLPNEYESSTRIYIDTGSLLAPLLKGISVESNLDEEVKIMERTLLSRPNLEQVMRMNDLDLTATEPEEIERLLAGLANKIIVTAQTKNLYNISYRHTNPQTAQSVAQSLLTIFVENNLGQSRKDMESARGFIDKQIAEYEKQLQLAEQRRAEFKIRNGRYLGSGSFVQKLEKGLVGLREAQLAAQDAEIRRDELKRQLASIPDRVSSADAMQFAAKQGGYSIDSRIAAAQQSLDNLMLQYTDKHPDVVATQRLIETLKLQKVNQGPEGDGAYVPNPLYENVKVMLIQAETNLAGLNRAVLEAQRIVDENRKLTEIGPRVEAELSDLDRDYGVLKGNYEELLARRESARISQAQEATSSSVQFRIIDPPRLPIIATSPVRPVLYMLSLFAGLAAGLGVAFVLATFNESFISSAQLAASLNLPVLGRVSLVRSAAESLRLRRDYWRFGIATASLLLSLGVMLFVGPQLVSAATKMSHASIISVISGAA